MYNKTSGTLVVGYVSLVTGTPSATLLPTPPTDGQGRIGRYFLRDLIMTTNDSAQPLVTLTDVATVAKFYVSSSSPTICGTSDPIPIHPGSAVTVTANAVTAAKTVEIKCTAILSYT